VTIMTENKYHEKEFEVRDCECDMAYVVNNSVYLNYLEHARHSMLKEVGIDFAELARKKIGLVIGRAEIDFIRSLVSGDKFVVKTVLKRVSRLRFEFSQDIFRLPDFEVIAKARIVGTPINANGRPKLEPELEALILPLLANESDDSAIS